MSDFSPVNFFLRVLQIAVNGDNIVTTTKGTQFHTFAAKTEKIWVDSDGNEMADEPIWYSSAELRGIGNINRTETWNEETGQFMTELQVQRYRGPALVIKDNGQGNWETAVCASVRRHLSYQTAGPQQPRVEVEEIPVSAVNLCTAA